MIERKPALAPANVPRHVAIIMDGNRRWAADHGIPIREGHRAGALALRDTVRACAQAGIDVLTVFAFSDDNWKRGETEVAQLMGLIRAFATSELAGLREENVRVRTIGRIEALPAAARLAIEALVSTTAENDGLVLNLALNYGARTELCDAIRALASDVKNGTLAAESLDDDSLASYLYTAGLPDPDLVIRTGGELRVSNFLLYQIAYAELWATPVAWPEFTAETLSQALREYASRQRRFGS
jgi:undecaprenyl diphosphate synthase